MAQDEGTREALNKRLDSWKEIAAYLGREVRTVQRWERWEGLPVHRHQHQKRGSVYALKSELDAWELARRFRSDQQAKAISAAAEPPKHEPLPALPAPQPRPLRFSGSLAAVFVGLFVLLVAAGYLAGRLSRAQTVWNGFKAIQGPSTPAVVVGDFNGDGKMDVALARPSSSSIYVFYGDGAGGFIAETTYSIQGAISGMAAGDFNRNGRTDLAVAADSKRVIILLADGPSGFRQHQEIPLPGVSTISAGDINGNGNVDLVASGDDPSSLVVLWGNGDGTFTLPQPGSGAAARSAAAPFAGQADWPEQ